MENLIIITHPTNKLRPITNWIQNRKLNEWFELYADHMQIYVCRLLLLAVIIKITYVFFTGKSAYVSLGSDIYSSLLVAVELFVIDFYQRNIGTYLPNFCRQAIMCWFYKVKVLVNYKYMYKERKR